MWDLKAVRKGCTRVGIAVISSIAAGIVILITDVIKKDCTLEAAAIPSMNENWRAVVKSGGMMTCFAVLGAAGLAVTFYLILI